MSRMLLICALMLALFGCDLLKEYDGKGGSQPDPFAGDGIGVNPESGIMRLIPSQTAVYYDQWIDLSVHDAGGKSMISQVDDIFLLNPQDGEVSLTRDEDGMLIAAKFKAKVGRQIVLIARKGSRYAYAHVYSQASAWLEVSVSKYQVAVSESLQIRVNFHQNNQVQDYTALINFTMYKPDGTIWPENNQNPIADLSVGGILTGKSMGFVRVLMKRTILGNNYSTEAWFMVGTPEVAGAHIGSPFIVTFKGDEVCLPIIITPSNSSGYPAYTKIYACGLYEDLVSTQPSVVTPGATPGKLDVFNDNQPNFQGSVITAKLGTFDFKWFVLVLSSYDAGKPRTGYGRFRIGEQEFLVVDSDLPSQRLGLTWDEDLYAHAGWGGQQFHSGKMARGKGYAYWSIPSSPGASDQVRAGFSVPIDPEVPDIRQFTPGASQEDQTFFGSDWGSNGQGGGDIILLPVILN